jgi:hypothetical protein
MMMTTNRLLTICSAVLTLVFAVTAMMIFTPEVKPTSFEQMDVQRINIREP